MFSFKHITSISIDVKQYSTLDDADKALCEVKAGKAGEYWLKVPTTMQLPENASEFEAVKTQLATETDVKYGDKTVTYPLWLKHLVTGWKLDINQSVQQDYKDSGATERRAKTASWYGSATMEQMKDLFQRMGAARTPSLLKAHNGWLDELYAANTAAVDAYVPKT